MNGRLSATASLGSAIHDVAESRIRLGDLLEVVKNWEADMAAREAEAIRHNQETGDGVLMATRARGMHLAVLALAVRLEMLLEGKSFSDPAL